MTEEQGLIHSVLASPGDPAPRLVYADWLQERGDLRGEWLRLLVTLDGCLNSTELPAGSEKRLQELQERIDPSWAGLMLRGRVRKSREQGKKQSDRGRRPRRDRREALEADVAIFLRQYARKTKNTPDPHDRTYSREVEQLVKRMRPEELDQLMRGDEE